MRLPSRICAVAATLCPLLACADFSTIELNEGGMIRAEILQQKADKIFVDLGFSILSIPTDAITGIRNDEISGEDGVIHGENLYRSIKDAPSLAVKELAERHGEAVVLIRTPTGLGSGFIIHPAGYVVTNAHVISGEHEISVTVFKKGGEVLDKAQYDNVRIVSVNHHEDLALLKIEAGPESPFSTVPLGRSDILRQGQSVFAIGNPLGLERSVSQGIISLKNRLINGRLFVQTTTQINSGNSGGPLFNHRGEVVGVNNMKVSAMGAEGLGFAIPADVLKQFLVNRDAFAFDPRNPNAGFLYNPPPETGQ